MFNIKSLWQSDSATGTASPSEEPTDADADEWPFVWQESRVERVEGQPVISHGTDESGDDVVFAGPAARKAMDAHRTSDDEPLWLGIGTRAGRFCGIERDVLFRHAAVFGTTGYGKSTLLKNAAKQIAEDGRGFAMLDPKGDDSEELMEMLLEDRLDDVVWVEPSGYRSSATGFNFLDVGLEPDDPTYDIAVENVVSDLQSMLKADDWWGPLMSGVAETLIRGTSRLDYDFTLVDLYYILESEENRQQFANLVSEEQLSFLSYTDKIAELDDDDLDAIRRRLKNWVENPIARDVIAERRSKIDIEEVVSEGKILIVRMSDEDEEIKKMISTAVIRRIWASVRSRSASREEREPFHLIADEFDIVASGNSNITTMLSKARSLRLSIILACQQPSQLPDDILSGIFGNCDTVLSFSPGNPNDARAIADNLDMPWRTLNNESNYHIWVQLTLKATRDRSDAFRTYTFPEYPPVRRRSDALHAIERACRTYGTPPKSDEEVQDELLINSGQGALEGASAPATVEFEVTDEVQAQTCKAVYDEAIRQSADDGWVRVDTVSERIRRYLPDEAPLSTTAKMWGNLIDHLPESHLEREDRGNAQYLRCTDQGKTAIFASGAAQNSGGAAHRLLLRDAYKPLTELGFVTEIPNQSGENLPDAVCSLEDIDTLQFDPENETVKDIADRVNQFEDDHPLLARLSDANDVYVESECSTALTAPAQTLLNLEAAVESGHRCLFLVRTEDVAARLWDLLAEDPIGMREHEKRQHRLYNANDDALSIGGAKMYRPSGPRETVWLYDETVDQFLLSDSSGEVHARFDSSEDIFKSPEKYPLAEGETEDYDDWVPVKRPVPVASEWCGTDYCDILLVDDWAFYEDGELIPVDELLGHETEVPEFDI